ncbi:MAG: DUF2155 domain-containing protein [Asticcacaulis sp.]
MTVVKSALLLAGATALALPLYAQNAGQNNDSEVYYIDGVEYRPFVPDAQKPAQPSPASPNTPSQPSAPATGSATSVSPGGTPYVTPDRPDASAASAAAEKSETPKAPPPPPEKRIRYGSAVIQALDKVTAETMRFEVKVGKSVRYKGLVFTVKACETSAPEEPMSDAMAYLEVRTNPAPSAAGVIPKPRQVFQGWSYASSPGLNPFEHPAYDAWVVACRAPLPVTVAGKE